MWNAWMDESQAGIKVAKRNTNNLRYANNTILTAESEEELKSILMRVRKESEKAGLKLSIQKTKIMVSGSITSWQIDWAKSGNSDRFYFLELQNHYGWWLQPWNYKMLAPQKESYDQPIWHIKKQSHYFADKGPYNESYGFSSSHVRMWKLDHKESWEPKNRCFQTVVLEKTSESPMDSKEIKPLSPKGNQPWILIGRTNAEAVTL